MAVRTNLLTNPSFETNVSGWNLGGAYQSNFNANLWAFSGTQYLASASSTTSSVKVPATPGLPYTGSGYFARGSGARQVALGLAFYDSSGAELSPVTLTPTDIVNPDTPERRSMTRTAPAGTTHVSIILSTPISPAAADAFLLEQSATLGPYFDGSTPSAGGVSYAWTGTAHASTSTATTPRTNLVKNPSFETNSAGWLAYDPSSTIVTSAAAAYTGTTSLGVSHNTTTAGRLTATYGTTNAGLATNYSVPVTAGQPVTVSMYVNQGGSVPIDVFPMIFWQDSAGNFLSSVSGTSVTTSTTWQRLALTAVAPAGAATFGIGARVTSTGNNYFYLDAVLAEISSTVGAYFDGASTASGLTYAWTGTPHDSTSQAFTGAEVKAVYNSPNMVTTANPTITVTSSVSAGDVLVLMSMSASGGTITSVSGCGATWTKLITTDSLSVSSVWVGTGATSTGTITMTAPADANGRTTTVWHATGTSGTAAGVKVDYVSGATATTPAQTASPGQIVFASTFSSESAAAALLSTTPATGWTAQTVKTSASSTRWSAAVHRVATSSNESHSITGRNVIMTQVLLGDSVGPKTIASALSATGTLTSALVYTKRISSAFSASGTLSAKLARTIKSNLSGSATLTSVLRSRIDSQLSSSTTLTSALRRNINSQFSSTATLTSVLGTSIRSNYSGTVTLTSTLVYTRRITSEFSGSATLTSTLERLSGNHIASRLYIYGALTSKLKYSPRLTSKLGGSEVVLYSELEYIAQPQPLAELPLGKLVRYTVNNFAVPLNPADGSGSTPSVSATYIKGKNPEFALGEDFTVDNGAVGVYTGEIVRLSLNKKSDVATISTDTMLTKTNVEMHLYPFIDTDPGLWTAARAIDYWTQQCGVFFDRVEGEVSVYASGFGHTNGYALGIADSHFYDKVAAGSVSTAVVNGRTVTSFGSAATTVMAQHEADKTRVPVNLSSNRRMVFSVGVGVRGTGRTASAVYNFIDASEHTHEVRIEVTSAGVATAKIGGVTTHTLTAPGTGNYRVAFSIQRVSATAMVGKLTIHSDDLDGHGVLLANSPAKAFSSTLPGTLWLTSVNHISAGGSGAEMLRWGTYLSVAKFHPMTLPAVQKELGQSKKPLAYVSGFSGNVWKLLNEFCSINRLDVSFLGDRIVLGPRANGFSGSVKFSDFTVDTERREKYKQVAVVNKRSKAVTTGDAVFWRADSVFQVAAREVFETTVQTGHSILSLSQPQAVTGIMPFPYKQGTGQYVVTGADGYIIAPQWWYDNGGKVEVKMTEKEGEIAIKITAPTIDTVRAPYRISEGEGDRPALYISGSGIMNDPAELHIATGAKNAREGFDNVFESPFIATTADAYNTAARMAMQYNAAMAEVSFNVSNEFGVPSDLGTYPAGTVFTDNDRNYKITDAAQTHSQTSGNAIPFTSIAAYNASFPEGATIRDENARHFGRTIKQVNIKPLRSNDE